jgi:hypothetical protein
MTARLPSHEDIELTLIHALVATGLARGWVDADTTVESLALGAGGLALLARTLNDLYALELADDDLQHAQIHALADIVLLVRLHLIRQQIAIE